MIDKKTIKQMFKKKGEELQQYLAFKRRHGYIQKNRKAYNRKRKHKKREEE